MNELTLEKLKQRLSYNAETGLFYWLISGHGVKAGSVAGSKDKGYIRIRVFGKPYLAHRLAWFYVHGNMPDFIDHKNGITADNRIQNLRPCTLAENNQNRKIFSGFEYVKNYKGDKKFKASIRLNGKKKHIGYFETAEEARSAYIEKKKQLHHFYSEAN